MNGGELAGRRARQLALAIGTDQFSRPTRGWQTRTADRMGIPKSTLNRILRSENPSIGIDVIQSIAEALPIAVDFFSIPWGDEESDEEPFFGDWQNWVRFREEKLDERAASPTVNEPPMQQLARSLCAAFLSGRRWGPDMPLAIARSVTRDPLVRAAIQLEQAADKGAGADQFVAALAGRMAFWGQNPYVDVEPIGGAKVMVSGRDAPVGYQKRSDRLEKLPGPDSVPLTPNILDALRDGRLRYHPPRDLSES